MMHAGTSTPRRLCLCRVRWRSSQRNIAHYNQASLSHLLHRHRQHGNKYCNRRHRFLSTSSVSNEGNFPTATEQRSSQSTNTNASIPNNLIQDEESDVSRDGNFLLAKYRVMAEEAKVVLDEHQIEALKELDRARTDILSSSMYTTSKKHSIGEDRTDRTDRTESPWSPFMKVFSFFQNTGESVGASGVQAMLQKSPKGVYLHGGVGCGKTFCMDLFYDSLPNKIGKQKVHFHKFMLTVHRLMHEAKMVDEVKGDVLPMVIERTVRDGLVICFDEFQVTDVADALILRRLFTGLIEEGAVIIATSNRPPCDLYLNGLQRDLFLPFIDLLVRKTAVVSMWDSEVDYRLVQGVNKARGVYFVGPAEKVNFDQTFRTLTKGSVTGPTTLSTQGRRIQVPRASLEYGVARFSFDDLCRQARGASDYITIAENFHTVFIEDIPTLTMNDVNLVRRLIVFVDSMYECHVKLIVQAAVLPEAIFQVDLDNDSCDEAFAFDRTRSRLVEMGSDEYLKSRWVRNDDHSSKKNKTAEGCVVAGPSSVR